MTTLVMLGLFIGVCLVLLVEQLRTPRPSLSQQIAAVYGGGNERRHLSEVISRTELRGLVLGFAQRLGIDRYLNDDIAADCRAAGTTIEAHLMARITAASFGLLAGPLFGVLLGLAGFGLSFVFPVWVSAIGAAIGYSYAGARLRSRAEERRRSFTHALSAFLDSVAMRVAGVSAPEAAVREAAREGEGWAFEEIRQALYRASREDKTVWDGLGNLGDELKVRELRELASSVQLSVQMGALLGQSLSDMAKTVRHEILSAARSSASEATSRMGVANALLGLSFVLLIVYAGAEQIVFGGA